MAFQKTRTLRSIKANPALRGAYRRDITALIKEMCKDVSEGLLSAYEKNESRITQDAAPKTPSNRRRTPAEKMGWALESYYKRWQKRWEKEAERLAKKHIKAVNNRVYSSRYNELKELGFIIKLNPSRYTNERFMGMVKENAMLLKSIPEKYFDRVSTAVMRSVGSGMDRTMLQQELQATIHATEDRAMFIARDQINKATQSLAECTDRDLGLTEGIWIHVPGRKMSRKTHLAMNGKRFPLDEGLWDEQVRRKVKPSELWLCCCEYRPVIPDTWKA